MSIGALNRVRAILIDVRSRLLTSQHDLGEALTDGIVEMDEMLMDAIQEPSVLVRGLPYSVALFDPPTKREACASIIRTIAETPDPFNRMAEIQS